MIQLNNYIQEKLYIGKDYKVDKEEDFSLLKDVFINLITTYMNIRPSNLTFKYEKMDGGNVNNHMIIHSKYSFPSNVVQNVKRALRKEPIYNDFNTLMVYANTSNKHIIDVMYR